MQYGELYVSAAFPLERACKSTEQASLEVRANKNILFMPGLKFWCPANSDQLYYLRLEILTAVTVKITAS
jgi:hypothetical protein